MKKRFLSMVAGLATMFLSHNVLAQVNISNAYSNMANWTVPTANFYNVNNGEISVTGNTDNQTMRTTVGTLSNTWSTQLNFMPTYRSGTGSCMTLVAVTAGIDNWNHVGGVLTTGTAQTNQDALVLAWDGTWAQNSEFFLYVKDGLDNKQVKTGIFISEYLLSNGARQVNSGNVYQINFERVSETLVRLTVKLNGNNVQNSPFEYTIPNTITCLNTIQQGTISGASPNRVCTARLTNFSINSNALVTTPTITASNTTICAGNSVTLTATTNLANSTINWFNVATGGTAIASGKNYTTTLNSTTTLYAEASENICGTKSVRKAITITVNPSPTAPTITGTKYKMCMDESVQLVSNISGGTWSISSPLPSLTGGAKTNSTISTTGLFVGNNPGVFKVRYTITANGCTVYSEKEMIVGALPFIITGSDKMCQNQSSVYTVEQPGQGNAYSWKVYQNPNIPISGPSVSDFNNLDATLKTNNTPVGTVLNLSATGAFECIPANGTNPAVYKYSEASKIVTIVANPENLLLKCADANCNTLTAVTKDGSSMAGLTFKWYDGYANEIGTSITVNNPKTLWGAWCRITNANGCTKTYYWDADYTYTCETNPPTRVYNYTKAYYCNQNYTTVGCSNPGSNARQAETKNYQLVVYPNPANNSVSFVTEGLDGFATLHNVSGVEVKTISLMKGQTVYDININSLPSGMYLLRVHSFNGELHTAQFIKE